jgi:amidase
MEVFWSLRDQLAALARREVSSRDLVAQALDRAEATQDSVHAFRVIRREAALAEAARADDERAAGTGRPLLGVPVAIKDDTDLAGESTPFGCGGSFPAAAADCEAVRRLREAGAVVIGKTHTPELGLYPWTEGPAFGATRNPWNLRHTPGGSSGGSAAAVAAGVVAAALGSDGAGSVRIPASWTNLVGLKPQRGRISTWPDPESFQGITCIGPLARSVHDVALLLDAVAGNHPGDLHQPPAGDRSFADAARRRVPRLRIAVCMEPPWVFTATEPTREVVAAVRGVAERMAGLGHQVEDVAVDYGPIGAAFAARASAGVHDWAPRMPPDVRLDPRTVAAMEAGRWAAGPIGRLAKAAEGRLGRRVGRVFEGHDLLLTPVTAQPPLPLNAAAGLSGWETDRLMAAACPYAWPWNYLGWPAMSVPAGFVGDGLPVGAQLVAPRNAEDLLISVAAEFEDASDWAEHHPVV